LKSVLQLVKASADEEQQYGGGQIAKESITTKDNRPLLDMLSKKWCIWTNESKLTNKVKISLPSISNAVETKLK
jgi:hypothetical protein